MKHNHSDHIDLTYSKDEKCSQSWTRVSVVLDQYFSDERSRCYVLVPRFRPVRWLESRLKMLFSLNGEFWLVSRGHLLPSQELLAILEPGDPIEVIPRSNAVESVLKGRKISSPKIIYDNHPVVETTNGFDTLDTIANEASLHKNSILNQNHIESDVIKNSILQYDENNIESNSPIPNNLNERCNDLETLKNQAIALLQEQYGENGEEYSVPCETHNNISDVNTCSAPKRARRRVRRRKRPTNTDSSHTYNSGLESDTSEIVQLNQMSTPRPPRVVTALNM